MVHKQQNISIKNKKAFFDYEIIETFYAGIQLAGTEIKSIREGKVNLQDGYVYFSDSSAFVKGMNISPFTQGTHYNHEAARERKLLMKKSEMGKLKARIEEKGLTIVPLRLTCHTAPKTHRQSIRNERCARDARVRKAYPPSSSRVRSPPHR